MPRYDEFFVLQSCQQKKTDKILPKKLLLVPSKWQFNDSLNIIFLQKLSPNFEYVIENHRKTKNHHLYQRNLLRYCFVQQKNFQNKPLIFLFHTVTVHYSLFDDILVNDSSRKN